MTLLYITTALDGDRKSGADGGIGQEVSRSGRSTCASRY